MGWIKAISSIQGIKAPLDFIETFEVVRWIPEGFLWFWFGFVLYEFGGGTRGPLGFLASMIGN